VESEALRDTPLLQLLPEVYRSALILGYEQDSWSRCQYDLARVVPLYGPCERIQLLDFSAQEALIALLSETLAGIATSLLMSIVSRKVILRQISEEAKFRYSMLWKRSERTGVVASLVCLVGLVWYLFFGINFDLLVAARTINAVILCLLIAVFKPIVTFAGWTYFLKHGIKSPSGLHFIQRFPDLIMVLEDNRKLIRRTRLQLRNRYAIEDPPVVGQIPAGTIPEGLRGPREESERGGIVDVASEISLGKPTMPSLPPPLSQTAVGTRTVNREQPPPYARPQRPPEFKLQSPDRVRQLPPGSSRKVRALADAVGGPPPAPPRNLLALQLDAGTPPGTMPEPSATPVHQTPPKPLALPAPPAAGRRARSAGVSVAVPAVEIAGSHFASPPKGSGKGKGQSHGKALKGGKAPRPRLPPPPTMQ